MLTLRSSQHWKVSILPSRKLWPFGCIGSLKQCRLNMLWQASWAFAQWTKILLCLLLVQVQEKTIKSQPKLGLVDNSISTFENSGHLITNYFCNFIQQNWRKICALTLLEWEEIGVSKLMPCRLWAGARPMSVYIEHSLTLMNALSASYNP